MLLPLGSSKDVLGWLSSKTNASVGGSDIVEKFLAVLANEGLLVITGDIMPCDSVVVDVVENAETRLVGAVDVEFGVVRLAHLFVSGLRPRVVAPAGWHLIGRRHFDAVRRPEPAVEALRLQVSPVLAAFEVAQAAARPDVGHVVLLD